MRSTDECEISRSCQSVTFSKAGTTALRTMRARPVKFSVRIGFRLWGMALEPFCLVPKNSWTSRTSVRCKCLISVARFSMHEAIRPRVLKKVAWRSLGITCVATDSGFKPSFSAT